MPAQVVNAEAPLVYRLIYKDDEIIVKQRNPRTGRWNVAITAYANQLAFVREWVASRSGTIERK